MNYEALPLLYFIQNNRQLDGFFKKGFFEKGPLTIEIFFARIKLFLKFKTN